MPQNQQKQLNIKPLYLLCQVLLPLFALVYSQACSYRTPPVTGPVPNSRQVPKTFFAEYDGNGNIKRYKTFVCGWTPEQVAGRFGNYVFAFYNHAEHCNIQFEITEKNLIGRQIDPTYPDQKDRDRWPIIVSIPIIKQYTPKPVQDKYLRNTTKSENNTEQDDPLARPYLELDLAQIKIQDWSYDLFWDTHAVDFIEDTEWDFDKNFLGFTLTAHSNYFGSKMQGKFRFNFLAFEHDPNFEPTPYSMENSKHVNILHVLGKRVQGDKQILYAARWDTKKTHTIYLNNFPKEYESIAHDVVQLWNDQFEKIGHGRPFRSEVRHGKYTFDLRYPGITWIDDKYLSLNAPLGVAMDSADVRNGKILWGGVSIWGGLLDKIIQRYTPQTMASAVYQASSDDFEEWEKPIVQFSLLERDEHLPQPKNNAFENLLQLPDREELDSWLYPIVKKQAPHQTLEEAKLSQAYLNQIINEYTRKAGKIAANARYSIQNQPVLNADFIQKTIGQPTLSESIKYLPIRDMRKLKFLSESKQNISKNDVRKLLKSTISQTSASAFDMDRTFSNSVLQWHRGLTKHKVNKFAALRALIKDLLLHEVGHMVGLGHNFKENILPEKGSKPHVHYNALLEKSKDNAKNYTTVMGYRNGITDVLLNYDEIAPGINDELVLRYLYNQEYPLYPVNANEESFASDKNFTFAKIPASGKISHKTISDRDYKIAYFDSCNDYEASFGEDPYCNRWDRGYDAISLVDNYFDDYKGNLAAQLYAFTNNFKGGSYWREESYLWNSSLNTFGRMRTFYDYMRQNYAHLLKDILEVDGQNQSQNLLDFSTACENSYKGLPIENPSLAKLFQNLDNPDVRKLRDLCVASKMGLQKMSSLFELPGPDFTSLNYDEGYLNASILGGSARQQWDYYAGAWKELSRTPIKISSLLTVTSPMPFISWYGWLFPIERYSRKDGSYLLNTFYPKEFSNSIGSIVDFNLTFGNSALENRTKMGKTVLALGYFLRNNYFSNDALSIDQPYIENIREQTEFQYNWAFISVERKPEEGKEIARKFSATIYQYFGQGSEKTDEIYMYTNDRTIMRPPARSLLYPVSSIRWYNQNSGYYFAIKMDYPDDYYDRLKSNSVRLILEELYANTIKKCIEGDYQNGLDKFFTDTVSTKIFPGFEFPANIHTKATDKNRFFASVDEQFSRYYKNEGNIFAVAPNPKNCDAAIRGQGLLVLSATAINGYYLQGILDFIEKGYD